MALYLILAVVAGIAAGGAAAFALSRAAGRRLKAQREEAAAETRRALDASRQSAADSFRRECETREIRFRNDLERLKADNLLAVDRLQRQEEELNEHGKLLASREAWMNQIQAENQAARAKVDDQIDRLAETRRRVHQQLLERTAQTPDEARRNYLDLLEKAVVHEEAIRWERKLRQTEDHADEEAKRLISVVSQRISPHYVEEHPHSAFSLEEWGGLKKVVFDKPEFFPAFEAATGVKLDWNKETNVLVLSCPNGVKREIARRTFRKLAGRDAPRIEAIPNLFREAQAEAEADMRRTIHWVLNKLRIGNVHPEVVKTMGRLKYRTSFSQNVLAHSAEVAYLGSMLASELGMDPKPSKRGSFLHDLGKAIDVEKDQGHALLGGEMAEKCGEHPIVVNAIAGHHEDIDRISLHTVVCLVADAISGARPGARRETTERYLERLEKLEEIARSKPGVTHYFAIQAGRELRLVVDPHKVPDERLLPLAQEVVSEIEQKVGGPAVEVVVTRETKVVDRVR